MRAVFLSNSQTQPKENVNLKLVALSGRYYREDYKDHLVYLHLQFYQERGNWLCTSGLYVVGHLLQPIILFW